MFDGFPPLDAAAAQKINMRINVNWLEGKVIEQQAVRQYMNNFTRQNNYFKIGVPSMPAEKRRDWELEITRYINQPVKRSLAYFNLVNAKFASVVRHGIGPQLWENTDDWRPEFVAVDDLRISTDTETSLDNLQWFAVRKRYTPGELAKKVFGREADKGWKRPVIKTILNKYTDINHEDPGYDWNTNPEKMLDLYKQDMGYYMSDAQPVITAWHFYYLDTEEDPRSDKWGLKIVPADFGIHGLEKNEFLYESTGPVANHISQLLHIQFGDLNGKPPFMYHSVRALGFLLMEPVYWMNLTRCRLLQHVWENFNILLKGVDPADRARSQKVELFDRGWLPTDVQIVPREQRHQIDSQLVEFTMAQMKQLMGESSAAYTQDIDQGTKKERTAYEVSALLNSVNSMLTGLLNMAYQIEIFSYREMCRRFCLKKTLNKDAQFFQAKCKKAGIPSMFMDASLWDITPDVPMGSGNQTLEMAQAQLLMTNRGAYSGQGQQEILHLFTAAATNSAKLAQELAPLGDKQNVNDAQRDAEFAFATLMQGVPVRMKEGLNPTDQIETLLGLLSGVIARVEQNQALATPTEVAGLGTVLQYVQTLMQQLATDPVQKDKLKQYGDTVGKLGNVVKAFGQRLAESQKSNQKESISINYKDAPPEIQRQMEMAAGFKPAQGAEAQVDAKTQKAQHQMALKEAQFNADQQRKDAQTGAEIQRMGLTTGADIAHKKAMARLDEEHRRKMEAAKPKQNGEVE
jgi:hypothetical protein